MATAVQSEILDEAVFALQGAQLAGIPSARIVRRAVPTLEGMQTPCVVVAQADQSVNALGGDNERDEVVYRFLVAIAWADNTALDDLEKMKRADLWLQRARLAFQQKRLPITFEGACVKPATVVQGRQYVPDPYRNNYGCHYWLVSVPVLEARDGRD